MKHIRYVPVYPPNKQELARLLMLCKGDHRTMMTFSRETQLSTSMLSRILNGNLTRPLSEDILLTIFNYRDNNAEVSLDQLFRANGYVPTSEIVSDQISFEDAAVELEKEKSTREVLMLELYKRGFGMKAANTLSIVGGHTIVLPKNDVEKNDFSFPVDFAIAPIGYGGVDLILFRLCLQAPATHGKPTQHTSQESIIKAVDSLIRESCDFLLIDAWHPEKTKGIVYSWVFSDDELYHAFKDKLSDAKLNGSMTIILVDTDQREVIREDWLHCSLSEGSSTPYNTMIV